jgi:hypothetical protein
LECAAERLTLRSFQEKLGLIFKATRTHARNLAKFATIYKLTMIALKYMGATPGKEGALPFLHCPLTQSLVLAY